MRVHFDAHAKREFDAAVAWYRAIRPELGARFTTAVKTTAERVGRTPLRFPVDIDDVRKCAVHRFPYVLRYALRRGAVVVLAVSHERRQPAYWVDRDPE